MKKFLSRLFASNSEVQDESYGDETRKRRWRLLQIEPALACNLRCVMCPWREIAQDLENQGLMSRAIWESIRPHLSEIQSIDFTGGGEPLLQPDLPGWIGDAHAAG